MKLYDLPHVAARIRELSEQTGIPLSEWEQWLDSEPPAGITPERWASALLLALKAPPLPEAAKRRLAQMAAPVLANLKAPAA
jgi:8-oxo-dGTP pyrophosphatase MutT (NUDIX family)